MDGVNSMTGNPPDLPAFAALAREHDALLYVDDATGSVSTGSAPATIPAPTDGAGGAVVRCFGERYDNVGARRRLLKGLLVAAGLCRRPDHAQAVPQDHGAVVHVRTPGPGGVAGDHVARLEVNRNPGDELRGLPYQKTKLLLDHLDKLGVATTNISGFPVVELPIADPADLDAVGRHLGEQLETAALGAGRDRRPLRVPPTPPVTVS